MERIVRSAYIHIPFCNTICSYCDFSKFIKNDLWVDKYLDSLRSEINENYREEKLDTLYIGGGTPSCLNENQLKKLFNILKVFKLSKNYEFTFECNIENIDYDKLKLLYENRVNRLSIGVQTFNTKYLKLLNRNHTNGEVIDKISIAKGIGFSNINIDLIYAIDNETIKELENDLNMFLKLNIPHISTYSLMINPNTKLYIDNVHNISEDLDSDMYRHIINKLKSYGYNHYEISNFAKTGYESKHNLTYWNNLEYYGFGLGASGYINNIRYDNTKSINKYFNREYISEKNILDKNEVIQNEFILGFRKMNGINKCLFKEKYNKDIKSIKVVNDLLKNKKLLEDKKNIYINPKYIYVSNDILINFIDISF